MRFFQYRATDSAGRLAEGTIRAASIDAARTALAQAGYLVSTLGEAVAAPAAVPVVKAAAARPAPAPRQPEPVSIPPAQRSSRPTPVAPVVMAAVAAPAAVATVKTKWGSDKELYFLFSQLGQFFRGGTAPQAAFHHLANSSKPHFTQALREVEKNATEGRPISEIFEKYPYLFPPDVVGVTRAGEVSGHLGEAFENISSQVEASARIKRRLSYFLYLLIGIFAVFPIIYAVVLGSMDSIKKQDQAGGSLNVGSTVSTSIFSQISHQIIPSLAIFAGFILFLQILNSMPLRRFRHQLVLRLPALGGRVRAEAIARFTWALGLVSRGGVSPQTTFTVAATCVPNLILRDQLMNSAKTMLESERLSAALKRSQALPVEYTHIVETGELTGDVPRALADIHRATDADLKAREGTTVTVSSILFYVGLGVITLFMVAFLYKLYASSLITTILGDS